MIVEKYGADTLRLYEMFLGPLDQSKPWDTNGIDGVHRFLKKLWSICFGNTDSLQLTDGEPTAAELKSLHKLIKKVTFDIEHFSYNTSVSAFMQTAGLDDDYTLHNEVGVLYGNDSTAKAVIETNDIIRKEKDTMMVGSGAIFQSMNSTVTMNLATIFKLRGINMTVSAACASGSHSIGLGYMFISQGMQDMILCGGAQEVNAYSMGSFDGLGVFSIRMDHPTEASRPFDANRDGLVPSGGAASLILEEYEHVSSERADDNFGSKQQVAEPTLYRDC